MISTAQHISNCRLRLTELSTERKLKETEITKLKAEVDELDKTTDELRIILEILQTASKLLYSNLSVKLGAIITEGLSLVFPESDLSFNIEFVERRNQIEADMYLSDSDGNQYDAVNGVGGGITDFISLLLRITFIKLSQYRDFIACDEPSKFISRDKIPEASIFLAKICKDLQFELLCVTHIPEMVEVAKKIYKVELRSGVSKVKVL